MVADITKIAGISSEDRLDFEYDPFVFDHPRNKELGILPSGVTEKSLQEILEVSKTSAAQMKTVYVDDFEQSLNLNFTAELIYTVSNPDDFQSRQLPAIQLKISVPDALIAELDHLDPYAGTDALPGVEKIDSLFVTNSAEISYYDFQMVQQLAKNVGYQVVGVGKDFETLFTSQKIIVDITSAKEKHDPNQMGVELR